MQRAIDRQARRGPVALELRIGVAAGDVAWEGEDYSGTPVIEAQRLCAAAAAGSILVAEAVRLLAGRRREAEFEDAASWRCGDLVRRCAPGRWAGPRGAPSRSRSPAPSLVFDGGAAFAGREEELAALRAAWADAVAGRRRGVLVSGEPGIGKTRLAAEIAGHAARGRASCCTGAATTASPRPRSRSPRRWARTSRPARSTSCASSSARAAGDLRAVAGARGALPGIAEPAPAEPEVERLRTLEAAAALLEAAGEAAPVLLVLDDLHWADDLSLLLLRHVLRVDASVRLLVVATYRDTEPSRSALLGEVVTGLARRPDVARWSSGRSPSPTSPRSSRTRGAASLAGRVHDVTEGNPFFVGEVVAALGGNGDPGRRSPRACATSCAGGWPGCPSGTAEVLAAAAVAGAEFDADVLAEAVRGRSRAGAGRLEAAEAARLSVPPGRWIASASRTRWCARRSWSELPAGRRVRLHARIAHGRSNGRPRRGPSRSATWRRTSRPPERSSTPPGRPLRARGGRRGRGEAGLRRRRRAVRTCPARAQSGYRAGPSERLDLELAHGRALALAGDERADGAPARRRGRAQRPRATASAWPRRC